MRLTCPACEAHYEIEPGLIPPEGREVQCAFCANRWFERPGSAPEVGSDPLAATPADPEPDPRLPRPSGLSPDVARILREEAEAERSLRQSDQPAKEKPEAEPESQPEETTANAPAPAPATPPVQPAAPAPRPAPEQDRKSSTLESQTVPSEVDLPRKAAPTPPQAPKAAAVASKMAKTETLENAANLARLNASLRAEPEHDGRDRFWTGLLAVIALALILALIYVIAPDIAERFPKTAPFLSDYTDIVDDARIWLAETVENLRPAD